MKNDYLKSIRQKLGMNQADFAKSIGLEQGSYSGIESGRKGNITKQTAMLLEMVHNVNMEYLSGSSDEMFLKNKQDTNVLYSKDYMDGAVPYYSELPVSAGRMDMVDAEERPTGWIKLPGVSSAIGAFPVVGCSMEPYIHAGDFVVISPIDSWEMVDPDKTYMIITNGDRMIKHLAIDNEDDSILWCLSPNYPKFKINKSDIKFIYRITFHGKIM